VLKQRQIDPHFLLNTNRNPRAVSPMRQLPLTSDDLEGSFQDHDIK
jgi:hypothetical protein